MSEIIQKSECHCTVQYCIRQRCKLKLSPCLPSLSLSLAPLSIAEWSVSPNPLAAQRKDPIVSSQILDTFTLGLVGVEWP